MIQPPFVPHCTSLSNASPARWALVLHGIFGAGNNLRAFAKGLLDKAPSWGFALVDLREHGRSLGAPPPHTVAAAAEDLFALQSTLPGPVAAVIGHSFGGKVAMAYALKRAERGAPLDALMVLDASPSKGTGRTSEARLALDALRTAPTPIPSRAAFIAHLEGRGLSRATAEWLAMNVRQEGDDLRLRLDLASMTALLDDYGAVDLWAALDDPGVARSRHVVVGGRSFAIDASDRSRLDHLDALGQITVHTIDRAGHHLHVDAPADLVAIASAIVR